MCACNAGAERLVKHLSSCQVPLAVATGSNQLEFALKSQSHKPLFALFHHCVLAGTDPEVKQSKPAPDCFLVAAARFPDKPAPAQVCIYLYSGLHVNILNSEYICVL